MRRMMAVLVGLLVLGYSQGIAADAAKEEQIAKLGAKRAVVAHKMQELQRAYESNSVEVGYAYIYALYLKISAAAGKIAQEETAKAAELRNVPALEIATRRVQKNTDLWNEYSSPTLPDLRAKWAELAKAYTVLNTELVPKVTSMDQAWMAADLDMAALTAALDAVGKRVDELKVRLQGVSAEADKVLAAWNAFAKEQ